MEKGSFKHKHLEQNLLQNKSSLMYLLGWERRNKKTA